MKFKTQLIPLKHLITLFVLIHSCYLHAEEKDSLQHKSPHAFYRSENQLNVADTFYNPIDTVLQGYQRYANRFTLGNIGLATLQFNSPVYSDIGFTYGLKAFNEYKYARKNTKYWNTTKPFTDLFFLIGSKKEQFFRALHTQNVSANLNVALELQNIRSEGFYQRQSTNHTMVNFSSNYKTSNNRYALLGGVYYNRLTNAENGGIKTDSTFENGNIQNKALIAVNLLSTERTEKTRSIFLKQFLNFGKKEAIKINDSTNAYKINSNNSISYSFLLGDNKYQYTDNSTLSGFYDSVFVDSTKTFDSTYFNSLEQELALNIGTHAIQFNAAFKNQLVKINNRSFLDTVPLALHDTSIANSIVAFNLSYLFKTWHIKTKTEIAIAGINNKTFSRELYIKKIFKNDSSFLLFSGVVSSFLPAYMYRRYQSNHFRWNNFFEKADFSELKVLFSSKKHYFKASLAGYSYVNPIVFNTQAVPEQSKKSLRFLEASINKDFYLGKFVLANTISYRNIAKDAIIRLPNFFGNHSLYYATKVFKKALELQTGVDVFYFSAYYANAYMPATSTFYLQNKKQIGNYPFVDYFINFKIKQVRIFVKLEHLNTGLISNTYYNAPSYPMADRAIKLGINWKFWN